MQRQKDQIHMQQVRRVIDKFGNKNVYLKSVPHKSKRYAADIFTTIIDIPWRFVLPAYFIATFGGWTFFAIIWYLIAYSHNDLTFDGKTGAPLHDGNMTCIRGVQSLTAFFLYSFEIQTTVGFGERYPNEECPEAIFMFCIQIIAGRIIDGTMIGIVFAKLTRPPRKSHTSKFSRKAAICYRDAKLCLMFRLCDPNEMHVINSTVQACFIGELNTTDCILTNPYQFPINLEDNGRVLVLFPTTICHVIDSESPLYTLSAKQFLGKRFEIVVTFTGTSASTGQTKEERTSYLSSEILWGHRFVNMMDYDPEIRDYFVDYDLFDETEEVNILLCSAQRFDEIRRRIENILPHQ